MTNQLPNGWQKTLLVDVIDSIVGGGTPSKAMPSYYTGNIPWMTVKDMNKHVLTDTIDHITEEAVNKSSSNLIPAGIPIIATRMSLGKIITARFDSAINQDLKAIFLNENIDTKYFVFWYRSFGRNIEALGAGTTVQGIRLEVLKALPFPLSPLAEQKEIVNLLDNLLAQVDTLKTRLDTIPNILKRFRQSVLAAAVSGKLTGEWRQQNPCHPDTEKLAHLKKSLIKEKTIKQDLEVRNGTPWFEIPDAWGFLELSSFALKITDGEHQTPKRESKGKYLLSARNVRDGFIDLSNVDYVGDEEFAKLRSRCNPDKNDILISCSGSVGRVSLVDESNKYVMVRSAALVKTVNNAINNKYLMYVLQSIYLQAQIEEKSKSTAQSNLFLGQIKELGIPYPHVEEQKEIVRRVDELFAFADKVEQQVKPAQQRVNHLTQSILAKAFRGELTAEWREQNPDLISGENSAAALLARIKTKHKK